LFLARVKAGNPGQVFQALRIDVNFSVWMLRKSFQLLKNDVLGGMMPIEKRRDDGEPQISGPFRCQVDGPENRSLTALKVRASASERELRARATGMHSL